MNQTDDLRRLLDERGVEYTQANATGGTLFIVVTSEEYYFILVRDNDAGIEMWSKDLTPEKAIEATLGPKTCHEVKIDRHYRGCSECGYRWEYMYAVGWQIGPKFCPNCGRRIEVDG